MKKIIAILAISMAFGLSANAQERVATAKDKSATEKTTVERKASKGNMDESQMAAMNAAVEKDLNLLSDAVSLDEAGKKTFANLFRSKYKALSKPELSDERKAVLAQSIEAKIKATLTPEQNEKLAAKPEVMKQLTH